MGQKDHFTANQEKFKRVHVLGMEIETKIQIQFAVGSSSWQHEKEM
jgi:hypothetical protein